jgi:hypothetical protein
MGQTLLTVTTTVTSLPGAKPTSGAGGVPITLPGARPAGSDSGTGPNPLPPRRPW